MKKLLIIVAAAMAISCRSPLMVYDEVTQSYMTEAEKKAMDEEREAEEKVAREAEEKAKAEKEKAETATITITIIIQ